MFALLFGLALAALLGIIYFETMHHGVHEFDERLESASDAIAGDKPDIAVIIARVKARLAVSDDSALKLLVVDREGRALGGDMPLLAVEPGIFQRRLADPNDPRSTRQFRVLGTPLAGAAMLAVGDDVREAEDISELIDQVTRDFAAGAAIVLALVIIAGGVIAWRMARRVETMTVTTRAIMDGALDRRLPVRTPGDELDTLAAAVNDMLARLETSFATVSQISTDIAHDLRSPLARLRRRLERLDSSEAVGALAETDRILAIFAALLRIGQIEVAHDSSRLQPVNLSTLLATFHEVFEASFAEAGQTLEYMVPPGLMVMGDADLLGQMIANMLENANRHTPSGSHSRIEAYRDETTVTLFVADNGPGVPASEREAVLRKFYRLDRSRTTSGNGLGLSMVAAIASWHGASLALDDNHPGLRVTLTLSSSDIC